MRVRRRPRVEIDLWEIADYIARDNPDAARDFLHAAESAFQELAQQPGMGSRCRLRSPRLRGVRRWVLPRFRNYLIYYLPTDEGIEVVRVIHGARDQRAALREGD